MDNQKILDAIKEHSPELMVEVAHSAIDAINEMCKNPEFNQLVEASIKSTHCK